MSARRLLSATLLGVALGGCGGTPVDYVSDRELGNRPGMFSGPKGAFVLRLADSAGEYEEFQRWKKDRAASEQNEFEEWREWRKHQRK